MAGRLVRLTYRYAVNIFFWDQWSVHDADLFRKHSLWQMFRWQFGPHRLGLGPLLSTVIEPHFNWSGRSESFIACSIIIVAALCALWLKKRLFGEIAIWDVAIPIIYLTATQYEVLFITTDLAHGPLPLLLITLYCVAWTVSGVFPRYVLVLALNFITIYTGFGVFLGFLTPLLLAADYRVSLRMRRRGILFTAAAVVIACASLASFFLGYTLKPAVSCFSFKLQPISKYLWYMGLMFANLWTKGVGVLPNLIGCAVVLVLLITLINAARNVFYSITRPATLHLISAALISYSLLFSVNTAFGRLCLGPGSAQSSRYTNYLALGIFGAYMHLLSIDQAKLHRFFLSIALIALLATVPIRSEDRGLMTFFSTAKRTWRECYLDGGGIQSCDVKAGYKISPDPENVLQQKLDFLKRSGQNLYSTR